MMQNKMLARAQVSEKLSWPKALAFISSRFVLIKQQSTNRQKELLESAFMKIGPVMGLKSNLPVRAKTVVNSGEVTKAWV